MLTNHFGFYSRKKKKENIFQVRNIHFNNFKSPL
jgi:hypothetical protein